MSAVCFEGLSTNPEILEIAKRVASVTRLSIQRAAVAIVEKKNLATLIQSGIEKDAFDFLQKRQKVNPNGVRRLAGLARTGGMQLNLAHSGVFLGTQLKLDFATKKTILEQARAVKYFDGLKLSPQTLGKWDKAAQNFDDVKDVKAYMNRIIKTLAISHVIESGPVATSQAPAKAKELHLMLANLKAVRRYGLEIIDWGNDHISCGGDSLDSTQQHVKTPKFFIHTFTHDGETLDFRDRTFAKFNLATKGEWPTRLYGKCLHMRR